MAEQDDFTPDDFVPDSGVAPPAAFPRRRPIPGMGLLGGAMVPAGGIAGGIAGTALGALTGNPIVAYGSGVAGATAGGAVMETAREALMGQPLNPQSIATAGGGQGAGQAVGVPAGKLVGRMASGLMRSAIKPGKAVQQSAVKAMSMRVGHKVTPREASIPDQALREGVGATEGGLRKVRGQMDASMKKLDGILSGAAATGKTFNVHDALTDIGRLRSKVRKQTDGDEALAMLDHQIRRFIKSKSTKPVPQSVVLNASGAPARAAQKGKPKEVPPDVFNEWKRTWQSASEAIYKAEAAGGVPGPRQAIKARLNQNVAGSARKTLEQFPGVKEQNQRYAGLRPLEQAILESLYRNTGQTVGAIPPAISWAVPGFVRSPENISRLALLLNSPMVRGSARYGPHVAAQGMFGAGDMEDETTFNSGDLPDTLKGRP